MQLREQPASDSLIAKLRQERNVDAANLVISALNQQTPHRFPVHQYYSIIRAPIFTLEKAPLSLVLHLQELANLIGIPPQRLEIVEATTRVHGEQKLFVLWTNQPQRERIRIDSHGQKIGWNGKRVNLSRKLRDESEVRIRNFDDIIPALSRDI